MLRIGESVKQQQQIGEPDELVVPDEKAEQGEPGEPKHQDLMAVSLGIGESGEELFITNFPVKFICSISRDHRRNEPGHLYTEPCVATIPVRIEGEDEIYQAANILNHIDCFGKISPVTGEPITALIYDAERAKELQTFCQSQVLVSRDNKIVLEKPWENDKHNLSSLSFQDRQLLTTRYDHLRRAPTADAGLKKLTAQSGRLKCPIKEWQPFNNVEQQEERVREPLPVRVNVNHPDYVYIQPAQGEDHSWRFNIAVAYCTQGVTKLLMHTIVGIINVTQGDGFNTSESYIPLALTGGAFGAHAVFSFCSSNKLRYCSAAFSAAVITAGLVDAPFYYGTSTPTSATPEFIINSLFAAAPAIIYWGPPAAKAVGNKLLGAARSIYNFFQPAAQEAGVPYQRQADAVDVEAQRGRQIRGPGRAGRD